MNMEDSLAQLVYRITTVLHPVSPALRVIRALESSCTVR